MLRSLPFIQNSALAQSSSPATSAPSEQAPLPAVTVNAPRRKPQPKRAQQTRRAPRHRSHRCRTPPSPAIPQAPTDTQDARTGTVGVYANSTSVATKTNTPLINIPQSVNVLTKSFIQDQSFQSVTEATRYVPGVAMHQGEGNRDELVIRGVDSSANFFVNGFRDDVQIFRDLYNTQSIEVLKGPSALTFGRGVRRRSREPHAEGSRLERRCGRGRCKPAPISIGAPPSMSARASTRMSRRGSTPSMRKATLSGILGSSSATASIRR